MEVVIDSNIIFRMLISGGEIIPLFFRTELHIYAPERLKEEFINNKEFILKKSRLSENAFMELANMLFDKIKFVSLLEYKQFLPRAKQYLKDHRKDEDFIALCILKNVKLWTYENRLHKLGFGITTKGIMERLKTN